MTIADLYKWAVSNEVEDYEIGLQYQDDSEEFKGNTYITEGKDIEASVEMDDDNSEYYILLS